MLKRIESSSASLILWSKPLMSDVDYFCETYIFVSCCFCVDIYRISEKRCGGLKLTMVMFFFLCFGGYLLTLYFENLSYIYTCNLNSCNVLTEAAPSHEVKVQEAEDAVVSIQLLQEKPFTFLTWEPKL